MTSHLPEVEDVSEEILSELVLVVEGERVAVKKGHSKLLSSFK